LRLFAILLVGLFLAIPAVQAQPQPGESLYVLPPKGWKIGYHGQRGDVELTEVIPGDQTIQDWSEMLTVQIITGRPQAGPEDVLRDQLAEIRKVCDDVAVGPTSPAEENGYPTAMRAIGCTKSKEWGKGELNLYKVLRGHERLYVVARSWRGEPFDRDRLPVSPETTKEWLVFMQQVVLCDGRDAQHPCPDQLKPARP
jgi:hypothetical protein